MKRLCLIASLALCLHGEQSVAQIEKIGQIQHTPVEEATLGVPVRIEGQVTHFHPRRSGLYLYDEESKRGIYVHTKNPAESYPDLKPGSIVRVEGKTSVGGFVPDVIAETTSVVGWRPLPEPRQFHFFEIFSPNIELDCSWLTVWGRLVDVHEIPYFDYIILELEVHGLPLSIQIPYSEESLQQVQELMFSRVLVPAVVGTIYNRHRQMTGRTFMVNSVDDFIPILELGEQPELENRVIEELLQGGETYLSELHTEGLVTYADDDFAYLRGQQTSLKAAILSDVDLRPGDYVDIRGFIWPRPISPAFRAREVKILEQRHVPEPKAVDLAGVLDPDWNYDLIETRAVMIEIGKNFGLTRFTGSSSTGGGGVRRISLLCRAGERIFEARLPPGIEITEDLKPGAELQLTGICNLVPNLDPRWSHFTEAVWMELRLDDGISIINPAPWWTAERLLRVLLIVLAISVLFMVWVFMLRRTVAKQTEIIGQQIEKQSIQNERHRVARELHDTLEQSLGGMSFQLESSLKQIDSDAEQGKKSLNLMQGMLRHCREESREAIMDLRGGVLEKMDLPAALKKELPALAEECGAKLNIKVQGLERRFQAKVERHIFRIAKEAVTNAVRHASPSNIEVELHFRPKAFELLIEDDGIGFEVERLSKSERFGLQGMRERANRVQGLIEIKSSRGQGTLVRLELTSTVEWELKQG